MCKFIKLPNGVIRKDLIKKITKYERDKYEGGTYYGIQIEAEEENYNYEEFGRNYYYGCNNVENAEKRRNEIYEDIVKQLGDEK